MQISWLRPTPGATLACHGYRDHGDSAFDRRRSRRRIETRVLSRRGGASHRRALVGRDAVCDRAVIPAVSQLWRPPRASHDCCRASRLPSRLGHRDTGHHLVGRSGADRDEVDLREEIELLESYVGIEQARLGDRLRVQWDVAPDVASAQVPPLLLQPLVENAIRHGVSRVPAGGRLTIAARRRDGRLALDVCDDGPGPAGVRHRTRREPAWAWRTRAGVSRICMATTPGSSSSATATGRVFTSSFRFTYARARRCFREAPLRDARTRVRRRRSRARRG